MKFVFFAFCFVSLFSCQWFQQRKDDLLTQLASRATDNKLAEDQQEELLELFVDIRDAKRCAHVQSHIEENETLQFFEKQFNLPRGFLFDGLISYSYETSLVTVDRSESENVVFSIVSVWKTEASLEEIEQLIEKVKKCYPDEYL